MYSTLFFARYYIVGPAEFRINYPLNSLQIFEYDKVGQQIGTRTQDQANPYIPNYATSYLSESAVYNAFGEVTSKLRGGNEYAYYKYDVGGRVWLTNADDGAAKVYLYDLQGNVTSLITSATLNLSTYASAGPSAVPTTLAGGVRRTFSTYDKRNKLLEQQDLGLNAGALKQDVRQTYDAWGSVLTYTTSGGKVTNYRYNASNQVIEERKPTTTYYRARRVRRAGSGLAFAPKGARVKSCNTTFIRHRRDV